MVSRRVVVVRVSFQLWSLQSLGGEYSCDTCCRGSGWHSTIGTSADNGVMCFYYYYYGGKGGGDWLSGGAVGLRYISSVVSSRSSSWADGCSTARIVVIVVSCPTVHFHPLPLPDTPCFNLTIKMSGRGRGWKWTVGQLTTITTIRAVPNAATPATNYTTNIP